MAEEKGKISQVIVAVGGSKFWRYVLLVLLSAVAVYWFLSWRARVQDVQLALLKQQNAVKEVELQKVIAIAQKANQELSSANEQLRQTNTQLAARTRKLVEASKQLKEASEKRVDEVATLPVPKIATDTAQLIAVPESDIAPSPDGSLVFALPAARANLSALIRGQTAAQQLDMAVKESGFLRLQNSNLEQQNVNSAQMLENQKRQDKAITDGYILKLGEATKEVQVVKAHARKQKLVFCLVGALAGAVATAVF